MEERICKLEDKAVEFVQSEEQKEKRMKNYEDSLRDLWETIKWTKTSIAEVSEGKERDKGAQSLLGGEG